MRKKKEVSRQLPIILTNPRVDSWIRKKDVKGVDGAMNSKLPNMHDQAVLRENSHEGSGIPYSRSQQFHTSHRTVSEVPKRNCIRLDDLPLSLELNTRCTVMESLLRDGFFVPKVSISSDRSLNVNKTRENSRPLMHTTDISRK